MGGSRLFGSARLCLSPRGVAPFQNDSRLVLPQPWRGFELATCGRPRDKPKHFYQFPVRVSGATTVASHPIAICKKCSAALRLSVLLLVGAGCCIFGSSKPAINTIGLCQPGFQDAYYQQTSGCLILLASRSWPGKSGTQRARKRLKESTRSSSIYKNSTKTFFHSKRFRKQPGQKCTICF